MDKANTGMGNVECSNEVNGLDTGVRFLMRTGDAMLMCTTYCGCRGADRVVRFGNYCALVGNWMSHLPRHMCSTPHKDGRPSVLFLFSSDVTIAGFHIGERI